MTACNERPPEGHPWHGTLVACHFPAGHEPPHAWDLPPVCQCGRRMRPVHPGEAGYAFGCWTCPLRPDHPGHDTWCPPE